MHANTSAADEDPKCLDSSITSCTTVTGGNNGGNNVDDMSQTSAEEVADSILIKICSSNATEIHLVFDCYLSQSIKDSEPQSRKEFDIPYKISGPQQTRPKDFFAKP
ncbi:unnamed protein product [Psylliodes chrysocephalus]|uniref:Uncharacterized protein n=1 Tax=Psylliodes chrysocephalus TaxID=3402493 RepID=A0A9P0D862_9CUCU|nr:unnamed protein product [Psylliodes chrysocephala]